MYNFFLQFFCVRGYTFERIIKFVILGTFKYLGFVSFVMPSKKFYESKDVFPKLDKSDGILFNKKMK